MIHTLIRTEATKNATFGVWLIDGQFQYHVLEDTVRPSFVKVKAHTAIPAGVYELCLEDSPRFGKDTPTIRDVDGFTGVRVHGGNTIEDTEGCPLIAFNRDSERIWGQAKDHLVAILKKSGRCLLIVVDYFKTIPTLK